jgi:2-haloalkanoic acid dehalogenase type II
MTTRPALLTFDVFGTVLDWRSGLRASLALRGVGLAEGDFDRVIDRQGALEQEGPFRPYREIVARSLIEVLGVAPDDADAIGREVGTWPAFPDARPALLRLMRRAPCAALTNSDRAHGVDVQARLGFRLSHWLPAEEAGVYKPDPAFWRALALRTGAALGPAWWHVSAYADYDLGVARSLGLTTVFVGRPHARPGPADLRVPDLLALADVVDGLFPREEPQWGSG